MPDGTAVKGGYQPWAATISGNFEHVGVEGFDPSRDDVHSMSDGENLAWECFTQAWWEVHGCDPVTPGLLVHVVQSLLLHPFNFRDDASDKAISSAVGKALKSKRDSVFGNLKVVEHRQDKSTGSTYWKLQAVGLDVVEGEDEVEDSSAS